MMNKKIRWLTFISLFPLVVIAAPVDQALEDELAYLRAERQIYSVGLIQLKEKLSKTTEPVISVMPNEIAAIPARKLWDVLRLVPGISQKESVLLLVDNHRFDFNSVDAVPIATVKRIDIVRGAGLAVHDATSFLVMINIIR